MFCHIEYPPIITLPLARRIVIYRHCSPPRRSLVQLAARARGGLEARRKVRFGKVQSPHCVRSSPLALRDGGRLWQVRCEGINATSPAQLVVHREVTIVKQGGHITRRFLRSSPQSLPLQGEGSGEGAAGELENVPGATLQF